MKLGNRWVSRIAKSDDHDRWVPAVNEIPSGSCCKYRLDKSTGQLVLARALPKDIRFPANYGFVPRTRSPADDEEIDVMVLSCEPILSLTLVRARIVGGFTETASDEARSEDKLLAVAIDDPNVASIRALTDVPREQRDEIEHFVKTYKRDEEVAVVFDGWLSRDEAMAHLSRGFKRAKKRAPE